MLKKSIFFEKILDFWNLYLYNSICKVARKLTTLQERSWNYEKKKSFKEMG